MKSSTVTYINMKGLKGFQKGHKTNVGRTYCVERNRNISQSLTGIPLSEAHKEKLRKAKIGTHRSEVTKQKISQTNKKIGHKPPTVFGENHYNWKGGITPMNAQIRHSMEYKLWRKSVFERDDYTCLWCGARNGNGITVVLNADHIKPFADYPELRFAIDNGRTLCVHCHRKTDNYAGKGLKRK